MSAKERLMKLKLSTLKLEKIKDVAGNEYEVEVLEVGKEIYRDGEKVESAELVIEYNEKVWDVKVEGGLITSIGEKQKEVSSELNKELLSVVEEIVADIEAIKTEVEEIKSEMSKFLSTDEDKDKEKKEELSNLTNNKVDNMMNSLNATLSKIKNNK